ncbi:putative Hyaluronidase [Fasciola gigantica]|uniref:protein O-GlcNAcase n=1 Tax=Fasciola gigantica TaxID=46835 RepID=A0A504YJ65_FASGI|nr:putative Hyaluronidase [Fasciola gigantica]
MFRRVPINCVRNPHFHDAVMMSKSTSLLPGQFDYHMSEVRKIPAGNEFLTGVVEGFYGRPWTYPQRKELFRRFASLQFSCNLFTYRMSEMGMNAYLYAPKDDIKHRQSWRDLYTPEEEQQLQSLITESTEAGVLFIFALSPGLDVTFSSAKEVEVLKKKVDQVSKLGCHAFALLFDDIEPRLCPADREVFSSSARAQVVFANDLYNYLGCPNVFLFCPTEYSASLAVPNLMKSEYLSTVASCLAPGIAVIWTGSLVVSKKILADEVQELSKLLQHPIVLWDNLHANDYDQRRVFIGPYSGRSLALRRKGLIRGVLSNPNCEFEANYVALHTLAQWSRHGELSHEAHGNSKLVPNHSTGTDTSTTEDENMVKDDSNSVKQDDADACGLTDDSSQSNAVPSYRPREALLVALRDWLSLMLQDQQVTQHSAPKGGPDRGTPVPMDTDASENATTNEAEMQVEPSNGALSEASASEFSSSVDVTLDDLELFADLFYLPFAHGPAGVRLLELGHYLREYSYLCGPNPCDPEKAKEWREKLSQFADLVGSVARLRYRIQRLPSRSIACELAPYITEVHTVLGMVLDYLRWLDTGVMATRSMCHLRRLLTWFSPGYRDMVTSGDQEPWTFRGGLVTELQRILPLESAQDLFPAPSRAVPGMTTTIPNLSWPVGPTATFPFHTLANTATNLFSVSGHQHPRVYVVRPYRPEDKPHIYALFRRLLLARAGIPETALPTEWTELPGDRYLLHYLEHSPETCFVVEGPPFHPALVHDFNDDQPRVTPNEKNRVQCVGFGFSSVNAVAWARDRSVRYRELLREKYPRSSLPVPAVGEFTAPTRPPTLPLLPITPQTPTAESAQNPSASGLQTPDEYGSATGAVKPLMTPEELIRFLINPFHLDVPEVGDIVEAANILPPPEPLGAALNTEPTLSGCLGNADAEVLPSEEVIMGPPISTEPFSEQVTTESKDLTPTEAQISQPPPVIPTPLLPDTAPPSPLPGLGVPPPQAPLLPTDSVSSSPALPGPGRPSVSVAGGSEALHTALTAHPATLLVEFDDLGMFGFPNGPTPAMLMNHNLGLSLDPPELVLDSVARRLFICLLAALKTVGAHGAHVQLDLLNEQRADLYRRFGFYPVPAASSEQVTVLARLI